VILYADGMTGSMRRAIDETDRRRKKQVAHNLQHGIVPSTIKTPVRDLPAIPGGDADAMEAVSPTAALGPAERAARVGELRRLMHAAAGRLDFEEAARLRDEALRLEREETGA
jgi:excinuclease ABC subunit B